MYMDNFFFFFLQNVHLYYELNWARLTPLSNTEL